MVRIVRLEQHSLHAYILYFMVKARKKKVKDRKQCKNVSTVLSVVLLQLVMFNRLLFIYGTGNGFHVYNAKSVFSSPVLSPQ